MPERKNWTKYWWDNTRNKDTPMKKTCIYLALLAFSALPFSASADDMGPETMDLKERFKVEGKKKAVIFPHRQHQASLECVKCHVSPQGGGNLNVEIANLKGTRNDFHTKFCWPCHQEMNVPKGRSCNTCH
ncbi:MAG: cytochrome C [Desulfobulbaceae bacterium]|uniref:Cytochrome C n=1 Tax=Candidatus Desulfobia pelagia TaxID=2841692 RepID=A0A8J6TCM5_9BACT|nr:cytochrome C [Candidatus Desulfobia pelagia]